MPARAKKRRLGAGRAGWADELPVELADGDPRLGLQLHVGLGGEQHLNLLHLHVQRRQVQRTPPMLR